MYDGEGKRVLAVLRGSQSRVLVRSDEIAPVMKHAIVAIEDRRFYAHRGVDLRGILRAAWQDIRQKKVVQGGSTITQQFLKNVYTRNQRSVGRKLKEAALAWQLEQQWPKDRILTAYLNTIYFGNGAYGIQQASLTYFGHGASELTLAEAALLAGIPSDPAAFDPVTNRDAAKRRRDLVLRTMLAEGIITLPDYLEASRYRMPRPQDVRLPGRHGPAQYFTNYVKQQLVERYGSGRVFGGGLRVYTTIDLKLQRLARRAIARTLAAQVGPDGPSAALVAIDPRNGRVLAMVGGHNYRESQFNLAVQGERQPGSSFKPFVLATALKEGISPSTTFVSEEVEIPLGDRVWVVNNYENADLGAVTLSTATTVSDNTVYAQLTALVGPNNVVRTAHELGITSPLRSYLSIGLGAQAVNPLEMARAFASFAHGGIRIDGARFGNRPRAVVRVRDESGGLVDENAPIRRRVLGPNKTAILTSLLERVVTSGTGRRAALADGRPAAGKTGTTENYGDAWFVGYTPHLAAAVWVGYPNRLAPMLTEYHGDAVAGGTYPAEIWKHFMDAAHRQLRLEPESFPSPLVPYGVPRRVVHRDGRLALDNGFCRNTRELLFFSGDGPEKTADCKPNEVEVPRVIGHTLTSARARLAAQPLTPVYVYRPARPRQRVGVVVGQYPTRGTLSSYGRVTLILPKPLHGVVPNLVGLTLEQARAKLERRRLVLRVDGSGGEGARVARQRPRAGVAAGPGMRITLVVARD